MSIYDSILQQAAQGYAQANQNQMAIAQMPTFADKFLAGLRQAKEDEYKHKMGESTLAMNLAYKQAQEEQMKQNAKLHNAQMVALGGKYVSENLMGEPTRSSVVETLKGMGLPSSMVPETQYETSTIRQNETSIPEEQQGAADYWNAQGNTYTGYNGQPVDVAYSEKPYASETQVKTPVPYSDWGAAAAFKQKGLDLKEQIANMSNETKMYLAQLKNMSPKDALQKLIFDYAESQNDPDPMKRMSATDFAQRKFYLTAKANPLAGPLATQGIMSNPWSSGSMAVSPNQIPQAPVINEGESGITARPARPQGSPKAPVASPGGLPAPDPNSREGRKVATEVADEKAKTDAANTQIDNLIANITRAIGHPGQKAGIQIGGKWVPDPTNPQATAYQASMQPIKTGEVLSQLRQNREQGGGISRVTLYEWQGLENAIASLRGDLPPAIQDQNLRQVLAYAQRVKSDLNTGSAARLRALGVQPQSNLGNPVATDASGKKVYFSNGKYVYEDGTEYQAPR